MHRPGAACLTPLAKVPGPSELDVRAQEPDSATSEPRSSLRSSEGSSAPFAAAAECRPRPRRPVRSSFCRPAHPPSLRARSQAPGRINSSRNTLCPGPPASPSPVPRSCLRQRASSRLRSPPRPPDGPSRRRPPRASLHSSASRRNLRAAHRSCRRGRLRVQPIRRSTPRKAPADHRSTGRRRRLATMAVGVGGRPPTALRRRTAPRRPQATGRRLTWGWQARRG